jgi:hypothetical protein
MISHSYCSMGTWLRKSPKIRELKRCRTMRIYNMSHGDDSVSLAMFIEGQGRR